MNTKILFVLGIVIIVIIAGVSLFIKKPANTTNQTISKTQNTTKTQNQTKKKITSSMDVILTSNGFKPNNLEIKIGGQVVWTNKSGVTASVNSDNHPTHLLWPFLNLGTFENEESVSVMFEKPGTYTYHNHYNPGQKGTIIVK